MASPLLVRCHVNRILSGQRKQDHTVFTAVGAREYGSRLEISCKWTSSLVLRRPIETATIIGQVLFQFSKNRINSEM